MPSPSRFRVRPVRWTAAFLLLLAGCAHAPALRTHPSSKLCEVREASRDSLFVEGGRALYVFQEILEPNTRGDVLLAGSIAVLQERGADGAWRVVRKDSAFGAVLRRGGEAVAVPAPIPTRLIAAPRAAARPDGTWSVVFAETHGSTGESRPDSAARLWHGILDGNRWIRLEPIPLPDGGSVKTGNAGAPIYRGDTLFWALPFRSPHHDVAVFSRREGRWTHEIVPTRFALYPRLAYSDTLGLVLAAVGSGGDFRAAEHLFLWTKRPAWQPLVLLVPETRERVIDPWISLDRGREVVSWVGMVTRNGVPRQEAHAILGSLDPASGVTVLDSAVTGWGDVPVRPIPGTRDGARLWALEHGESGGATKPIRIIQDVDGSPVLRTSGDAPFVSGFAAAMPDPAWLLLAGGVHDPGRQLLISLVLRYRVECP